MKDLISGHYYRFIDPDSDPCLQCSTQKGWEFIEYADYNPGDILRGNLWIIHTTVYYHKIEVLGDGSLDSYGKPVGTIEDLQEST